MRRWLVIVVFGLRYRVKISGIENIPTNGPVLLLGNHVSYIDWAFVQWATSRTIRFVMHEDFYNIPILKWFWRAVKVICVRPSNSRRALESVIDVLEDQHIVGIFPEGEISRTGELLEFKRGFEKILSGTRTDLVVIPFAVNNMCGSILSKTHRVDSASSYIIFRRKVHIHFGEDLSKNVNHLSAREAVRALLD